MNNLHNDRYDEIKSLLKKSRLLSEQSTISQINVAKDIEDKVDQDYEDFEVETGEEPKSAVKDKVQKYRVSGGILALHGKGKTDLDITSDDKIAFQESMDEFIDEVSDLVDFNTLNVYPNNVEWSGKIIDEDIEFTFTIGEDSGLYIEGTMIKVDDQFLEIINKLQQYYQKFKSRWAKIIAVRKKTREVND